MTTGRLVLVRHGQTEWSETGRHTGNTDVPLTAEGEARAAALRPRLEQYDVAAAYTSPLQRASRTAQIAGLDAQVDGDLVEWDYGGFEGLTTREIGERLGRPWSIWEDGVALAEPPGETIEHVAARAQRVLERCRPLLDAGRTVALVAHGHYLRVLASCWLEVNPCTGALLALSAGSLSELGYEHDRRVVRLWNLVPG